MESGLTPNSHMGETTDSILPQAMPDTGQQDSKSESGNWIDNAGSNEITPESQLQDLNQNAVLKACKSISIA